MRIKLYYAKHSAIPILDEFEGTKEELEYLQKKGLVQFAEVEKEKK